MRTTITLQVKDMHRITDSMKIEKALNSLPSVRSRVNIASGNALVKYNPQSFSLDTILDTITDCGFVALIKYDQPRLEMMQN